MGLAKPPAHATASQIATMRQAMQPPALEPARLVEGMTKRWASTLA